MTALETPITLDQAGTKPPVGLVSGFGQYHSATAEQNPRDYTTISPVDVLAMVEDPQQVAKQQAQWFIPSTLSSRVHKEQREQGTFWMLWAETDEPRGQSLEAMATALEFEILPAQVVAYTSRSATEDNQKARFLVPLSAPVSGADFVLMQKILNDKLQTLGIEPDRANERAGQLCYLPNRGDFYAHHCSDDAPLNPKNWAQELEAERQRQQAEQDALREAREQARIKATERMQTGMKSPIDAFNAAYPVPLMFNTCGFMQKGRNRWLSPNSSSKSPAVRLSDDGYKWFSHHESDAGMGQPHENGGHWGDAFDLFVHFQHHGNRNEALKAAGKMFTTAEGNSITKQNQINYMEAQSRADTMAAFDAFDSTVQPPSPADGAEPKAPALLFDLEAVKVARYLETEVPPRRYVVDGLVPEPVAAAIVAPGGTGKSYFIMQLACCVAAGLRFFGNEVSNPGAVLMLAAEDDRDELARRVKSITSIMRLNHDMTAEQERALGERFYAASRLGVDNRITHKVEGVIQWNWPLITQIIETARAIPDLRLIILDPVSRFRSGDENANEDATKFVEALEIIRQQTGVTVLTAHHSRKGSTGESQDDIRGASAFVDALRFAATLYTPPADVAQKMGIDPEEARSWVRFSVVKSNYQTDVDQMWFKRGQGGVLMLTTPPSAPPSKAEAKGEERYQAALPKIREMVRKADSRGDPMTARQFRDHGGAEGVFGMGIQSLNACVSRAIEEGEIHRGEDSKLRLY